jgi:hypothetical protein
MLYKPQHQKLGASRKEGGKRPDRLYPSAPKKGQEIETAYIVHKYRTEAKKARTGGKKRGEPSLHSPFIALLAPLILLLLLATSLCLNLFLALASTLLSLSPLPFPAGVSTPGPAMLALPLFAAPKLDLVLLSRKPDPPPEDETGLNPPEGRDTGVPGISDLLLGFETAREDEEEKEDAAAR